HPDVFNVLLQVLDDGRLTDNKGRTVNFKNTIIIMTSNAPRDSLFSIFRPEFLNRVDEIIEFTPLGESEIRQIVKLQIDKVTQMVAQNGVTLHVDDKAVDYIAKAGFDPQFGARPVKRAIQDKLLNELSKKMLSGEVSREKPIEVSATADELLFS
ncbi:MAG: AAA family ATPase, partial [Bacteroidaceae bacterium]|nr:AAA family ATPase [Bacteroidaceae bacterium]